MAEAVWWPMTRFHMRGIIVASGNSELRSRPSDDSGADTPPFPLQSTHENVVTKAAKGDGEASGLTLLPLRNLESLPPAASPCLNLDMRSHSALRIGLDCLGTLAKRPREHFALYAVSQGSQFGRKVFIA